MKYPFRPLARSLQPVFFAFSLCCLPAAPASPAGGWAFTDVTATAGLGSAQHGLEFGFFGEPDMMSGGTAAADIDGDGDQDLLVVRGDLHPVALYRNRSDGTFEEAAAELGLAIVGGIPSGAAFADLDGNGAPDLLLGGVNKTEPRLYMNDGTGHFTNATGTSGLGADGRDTFSAAFADIDHDGDLDIFLTHWWRGGGGKGHLWKNLGNGAFQDIGLTAGFAEALRNVDYSFTPNFADIDSDGWPDLLLAADFNTSRTFRNQQDGTFAETTDEAVLTDQNGMGAAVGDYDNDGDLDWFISSIWDPNGVSEGNWGTTGNRLYKNRGDGSFEDVTEASGVRIGYWGWGSCMTDLDNDGHLDIFHVNGFWPLPAAEFYHDPARLFVSNGNGTFTERAAELGLDSTEQGRGIACFDYDRDGDIDLFIQNNTGFGRLFRNDLATGAHHLTVRLRQPGANSAAVGARVYVTTAAGTQMRELAAGNNFLSSNPIEAHFGLGAATAITELKIAWPDGEVETRTGVAIDQALTIVRGQGPPPPPPPGPAVIEVPALGPAGLGLLALGLAALAARRLAARRG